VTSLLAPKPISLANDKESRQRVGAVFRAVRLSQRRRSLDVATAMGMPHRTYQAIEAGVGQAEIGDLEAFARATGADTFGVIAAILCGAPEVAEQTGENKLMLIASLELADLLKALGPTVASVKPHQVLKAVSKLKRLLQREVYFIDQSEDWLERRSRRSALELEVEESTEP
jgi:transcriptional regulator with XRE-family HTH domain